MAKRMKILAVGCLHGDLTQAKQLAEQASREAVDLVLFAGDFTQSERHTPGLFKVFKEKGLNLALIPGNHESPAHAEAMAKMYGMKFLHGYYAKFGDVAILGAGSANFGIFGLSEKELYDLLKRSADKVKGSKKTILVTHAHPSDTKIDMDGRFFGSDGIRRAIDKIQPTIAISSNIHEAEGIEDLVGKTRIISVGKQGKIIEI
jgi:Icc-related predicted phosphoesterase